MRRLLRLLALCVIALALPLPGALAATAMVVDAGTDPEVMTMAAADSPCHDHAPDKTGCGDCCGPIVAQRALLAVAPVAARWAALPRSAADVAPALFLTGGTERPPRRLLAHEAPPGRA